MAWPGRRLRTVRYKGFSMARPIDYRTSLRRLLAEGTNFEICNSVFVKSARRHGNQIELIRRQPVERVVTLTWHSFGIIGNGGFHYLLEGDYGDPGYALTAEAFRTIGAADSHRAFLRLFKLYPNNRIPRSIHRRLEHYCSASTSLRDMLNSAVWRDTNVEIGLATFIRENIGEFQRLGYR